MVKDSKAEIDYKFVTMKIPKDIWVFLKKEALDEDTSIRKIITQCFEKYKKKEDAKKEKSLEQK